ncbi:hypothetical protein AYR46_16830 [Sphingobium yanoikuyae]|nr:hypothetical protein AYR46_16830 [Sphingobium yanoikuyae]
MRGVAPGSGQLEPFLIHPTRKIIAICLFQGQLKPRKEIMLFVAHMSFDVAAKICQFKLESVVILHKVCEFIKILLHITMLGMERVGFRQKTMLAHSGVNCILLFQRMFAQCVLELR